MKKRILANSVAVVIFAAALVFGSSIAASAETRTGYTACLSTQTANLKSSVTATAPSNAPSSHFYNSSGRYRTFTGPALKTSTNATNAGGTGWQISSPYALSNGYQACGPNPV